MLIYFFDWWGLSAWIAPPMNREWGILENGQLLLILATLLAAVQEWRARTDQRLARWFFCMVALGSVFIFLEEIDYGLHLYDDFVAEETAQIGTGVRNLHNQGSFLQLMKLAAYMGLGALVVLLPFVVKYIPEEPPLGRFIHWLQPVRALVIPLVVMILLNQLALYLDRNWALERVTALNNNISEFEEVFIYFIVWRYIRDLSERPYPNNKAVVS
jgi:hypothetical protein